MNRFHFFSILSVIFIFTFVQSVQAQAPPRKAEFPGGMGDFYKWINQNLKYPEDAKTHLIEGDVTVSFIIKENGEIYKESVKIKKGVSPSIDQEAIRLIKASPIWVPARDAELGNAVPVRMSVPISFAIPIEE